MFFFYISRIIFSERTFYVNLSAKYSVLFFFCYIHSIRCFHFVSLSFFSEFKVTNHLQNRIIIGVVNVLGRFCKIDTVHLNYFSKISKSNADKLKCVQMHIINSCLTVIAHCCLSTFGTPYTFSLFLTYFFIINSIAQISTYTYGHWALSNLD